MIARRAEALALLALGSLPGCALMVGPSWPGDAARDAVVASDGGGDVLPGVDAPLPPPVDGTVSPPPRDDGPIGRDAAPDDVVVIVPDVPVMPCPGGRCAGPAQVALGTSHSCARFPDGTVSCWGSNDHGQLGDGSMTDALAPQPSPFVAGVVEIAAGGWHTCAIVAGGAVMCWGDNTYGQLGDVAGRAHYAPFRVPGLVGAVQLALGRAHSCARMVDGTVRCWGSASDGQLGTSDTGSSPTPVMVPGVTGVVSIAAGLGHTCAVLTGGELMCWGSNQSGQIGDGSVGYRATPTRVGGPSLGAVEVGGGEAHTCVRDRSGGVSCWGSNRCDQLGLGGATTVPRAVPMVTAVAQLAVGQNHTCVRLVDGTVQCWGSMGGCGAPGSTPPYGAAPVTVVGRGDVIAVRSGERHACYLRGDSALFCWGLNTAGQLGDGTMTARLVPAVVRFP